MWERCLICKERAWGVGLEHGAPPWTPEGVVLFPFCVVHMDEVGDLIRVLMGHAPEGVVVEYDRMPMALAELGAASVEAWGVLEDR